VTGATTSLINRVNRRAEGDASLAAALLALPLVPLPALLAVGGGVTLPHVGVAATLALLGVLLGATPLFALPPCARGCRIGAPLHVPVTAPERFQAIEDAREAPLQGRALVARSLLVGGIFAATGLVVAITIFRVA
jgi:hypothetical protein